MNSSIYPVPPCGFWVNAPFNITNETKTFLLSRKKLIVGFLFQFWNHCCLVISNTPDLAISWISKYFLDLYQYENCSVLSNVCFVRLWLVKSVKPASMVRKLSVMTHPILFRSSKLEFNKSWNSSQINMNLAFWRNLAFQTRSQDLFLTYIYFRITSEWCDGLVVKNLVSHSKGWEFNSR